VKDIGVPALELRKAYGDALLEIGKQDQRVVVLDADVSQCTGTELFEHAFPDRFFQFGVAEQNMMGAAAGFATCGYIPFANTFAVFATKRPHDQISISIAYPNLNVKVVGSYAGLSSSNTGATHQSIDDISTMRGMPNLIVVSPGDPKEVRQAVFALAEYEGPAYLRLTKSPAVPNFLDGDYHFEFGKAVVLQQGQDVALVGTGMMSLFCVEAAVILKKEGIQATVLHMPTVKPIDRVRLIEAARQTGAIVTVEDHSIIGGLGSAVSEVLSENHPCLLKRIGIEDVFTESALEVQDLFAKYGLTGPAIAEATRDFIRRHR
jgi:transketolase